MHAGAHTHTHGEKCTGQGPSAGTNHLLKLLWRSWQSARGRHDFGSHSCPHQQSKMFLGVDPWQPLLLQSSFITVTFYKRENKPFFCTLTDCQYSSTNPNSCWGSLFAFEDMFWIGRRETAPLSSYLYGATTSLKLYNIMKKFNLQIDLIQNTVHNYTAILLKSQCSEKYWRNFFPTNTKKKTRLQQYLPRGAK